MKADEVIRLLGLEPSDVQLLARLRTPGEALMQLRGPGLELGMLRQRHAQLGFGFLQRLRRLRFRRGRLCTTLLGLRLRVG